VSFNLLPQAISDIVAIATYINAENPRAATKLVDDFYQRFRALGAMPGMGVQRPDIAERVRSFPVGNYLILYHQEVHGVDIVRVVDGRSSLETWLG
jgi:toxin ParE1/3/4